MNLKMHGVREHNLKNITVEFCDGITAAAEVRRRDSCDNKKLPRSFLYEIDSGKKYERFS